MKKILPAILASTLILSLAGCHPNSPREEMIESRSNDEAEQKPIAVLDLHGEFKKDWETASKAYAGKRLTVTGTVVRTGPDPHQKPAIELAPSKGEPSLVLCVVNSFDQLDGIAVEDVITASGNFYEFWQGKWVVLKQSEVHAR